MDWVKVGQRVKCVAIPTPVPHPKGAPSAPKRTKIGDEGVISGTVSRPNRGFNTYADRNISVTMDHLDSSYMAPHWCFAPISKPHEACDDSEFIASLDRLAAKVEEVA